MCDFKGELTDQQHFYLPWGKLHAAFSLFVFLLCPSASSCSPPGGKRGGAKELRLPESVFRQRRWQAGSLIVRKNISSDGALF